MNPVQYEIPEKVQLITDCLGKRFYDVRPHSFQRDRLVFHDGQHFFQFGFFRPVLEDLPLKQLRTFMETEVIPMIVQNPGMQIIFGTDGLSVRDSALN